MLEITIVVAIPLLVIHHSEALSESTHGTRVAFTTAFWTIHGLQMLWASLEPRGQPSCRMRILKVLSLISMLIWVTKDQHTPYVAERNGSSCAPFSGMGENVHWSQLIAQHGTQSSDCEHHDL